MIFALLRLIRFPNLVIVVLTQYLLYYAIFYEPLQRFDIDPRMDSLHFFQLVLITVMLTAGGYVINDIMDLEADWINKPEKMVVDHYISRRTALWIYFCLQIMGFFLALYLSFYINNLRLLALYPSAAIGLYLYSSHLKRQPMMGHLLIAFYCAGVALVVLLAELPGFLKLRQLKPSLTDFLLSIIISYASFAFLTTLLRELIKVLEDEAGDRIAGYNTTAIAWGQEKVKGVCIILSAILLLLLLICGLYYSRFFNPAMVTLIAVVLTIPIFLIIYSLGKVSTKSNFKQLSRLTKLLMLLGVLVLLTFA